MMQQPKGLEYWYTDEKTGGWRIKEDAPGWAKNEFEEYQRIMNQKPDENDIVTLV
jgi:hypothetical protein